MIYGNVDGGERKGDRGRERRKKERKKESESDADKMDDNEQIYVLTTHKISNKR